MPLTARPPTTRLFFRKCSGEGRLDVRGHLFLRQLFNSSVEKESTEAIQQTEAPCWDISKDHRNLMISEPWPAFTSCIFLIHSLYLSSALTVSRCFTEAETQSQNPQVSKVARKILPFSRKKPYKGEASC